MLNSFKNIILCSFILLNFAASYSMAQNEEEIFLQGNEYYRLKEFGKAIEVYNGLVNSGFEGTSLYYNLGNSYYRTGKIGLAILYYEKALKLSPGDEDIRHNLALANLKTIDKVESLPKFFLFEWWDGLLALFTTSGWTIVTYIFYVILILSIGFYFFVRNSLQQKIVVITGLLGLAFLIISTTILTLRLNKELNIKNGVVVENVVNVKLSPDYGSDDAFIIHEGIKVRLEDKVDNWVKIRLEDGKVGWIPEDNAKII
ncbi:MAG: tetratricopeptide repeat protein [Ignavibacteriales bacterium]|nr:MAG: tetratricopeptide repeat protein [Ignavibacteriales bacterium]